MVSSFHFSGPVSFVAWSSEVADGVCPEFFGCGVDGEGEAEFGPAGPYGGSEWSEVSGGAAGAEWGVVF